MEVKFAITQSLSKQDGYQSDKLFRSELNELSTKLDNKIAYEFSRLELKIEQSKNETIRWFIGLFIALALMIIGIYIKK